MLSYSRDCRVFVFQQADKWNSWEKVELIASSFIWIFNSGNVFASFRREPGFLSVEGQGEEGGGL